MTAALKACGIVITALFASLLMRDSGKTVKFAAVSCAFLAVLIYFTGNGMAESVSRLFSEAENYFPESAKIMLKALGIAYLTAITGELCTSAGENSLAAAAALAGKVQIIVLCIPLLSQLLKLAGETL